MNNEEIDQAIKLLEQTPSRVETAIAQLSSAALKLRNDDEFSALESICHLRDIEIEGYGERIVRILREDNPALADIDGARLANERDYNNQNVAEALAAFREARHRNLEFLKGLTPDQLGREGTLENVGVVSLEQLIEMMKEHDQGHLAELKVVERRSQRSETAGF
jgi:hypothetical protein